jgi:hypothetical protein
MAFLGMGKTEPEEPAEGDGDKRGSALSRAFTGLFGGQGEGGVEGNGNGPADAGVASAGGAPGAGPTSPAAQPSKGSGEKVLVNKARPATVDPNAMSSRPTVLVDAELWEEMKHALNHLHDTNTFIEKEKEAAAQSIVRASYDLMMRDKAEQQMKAELETRRQMAAQMEQEVKMLEKWDSLMEKRERLKEMMLEDEDLQNAVELKANEVAASKNPHAQFPNFPAPASADALAGSALGAAGMGMPAGAVAVGSAQAHAAGPPMAHPGAHPGLSDGFAHGQHGHHHHHHGHHGHHPHHQHAGGGGYPPPAPTAAPQTLPPPHPGPAGGGHQRSTDSRRGSKSSNRGERRASRVPVPGLDVPRMERPVITPLGSARSGGSRGRAPAMPPIGDGA